MSAKITIDLKKTDFTGGDVVEGELVLAVTASIPVRGVRILFHGYEQSYWSRGGGRIRSSGTGRHRLTYTETRELFREEVTLYGDPPLDSTALISDSFSGLLSSGHYHKLEPGEYRYPFSYALPEQLPSDYCDNASRSKIEYLIKGYVDIPLKVDIETCVPLTVYETDQQTAVQPVSASTEKTFAFEAESAFKAKASLDKNMYLPGEAVNCRLWVENSSKSVVQGVTVSLQKRELLNAQGSSTINEEPIRSKQFDSAVVAAGETRELDMQFNIPGDLYPTIVSSELLKVEYQIVVSLDIPWALDLSVEVPIVILEEAGRPGGV